MKSYLKQNFYIPDLTRPIKVVVKYFSKFKVELLVKFR